MYSGGGAEAEHCQSHITVTRYQLALITEVLYNAMVQLPSGTEREESLAHNIGAYHGLRFPVENVPQIHKRLVLEYLRSILPTSSSVPYAETIWKFDLSDDGTVRQVPQRSDADPDDLPNPFAFSEVFDQIVEGLTNLNLSPPPPLRHVEDIEAWHRASALDRQIRESRQTWMGKIKAVLAAIGLADGDPEVVYPPYVSDKEQMFRLQSWVNDRMADGTLSAAILRRSIET